MANPDVRIRLSAEGVAEVVGALRKVQEGAKRAGDGAAHSFGGMNKALEGAKGLVAALTAAVSVGALVALARDAAHAADEIGKMAQKIGSSVENLSALRLRAVTADVDLEKLTAGFAKFNKSAAAFTAGSDTAQNAFKRLGVSVKDLTGKDAAERLDVLAAAFGKLKDGPEKSALALQIFGRAGQNLIPLLNQLSEGGLKGAREEAERLGVALTDDTARAAQAVNDDFKILTLQLQTGFMKVVEGLAPAIHTSLTSVQDDLGASAGGWKVWGQIVGKVLAFTILGVEHFVDTMATAINELGISIGGMAAALAFAATGRFKEAGLAIGATADALRKAEDDFDRRNAGRLARAENVGFVSTLGVAALPKLRAGVQDTEAESGEEKAKKSREAALALAAAKAKFAADEKAGQDALKEVERERAEIAEDRRTGIISEKEAQEQLNEANAANLPILKKILAYYQAIALLNPFDVEAANRARDFALAISQLDLQIDETAKLFDDVKATAREALRDSIANGLTNAIREGEKFVDVMRNIALAVIDAIAQLLAFKLASAIVSSIPFLNAGGSVGAAEGGFVSGPGTGTSDSIPARLSDGEFVVRARAVAEPGMLDHLRAVNEGMALPRSRGARVRRFAEGGLVRGAGEGAGDSSLTVSLAPGLVVSELSTPEGQRAVVRVLAKNSQAVAKAIG